MKYSVNWRKLSFFILFIGGLSVLTLYVSYRGISPFTRVKINDETQNKILAPRLKQHVKILSEDIGARHIGRLQNLYKAEEYIINQFKIAGYEPQKQEFSANDENVHNIIAVKKGMLASPQIIIIGAHYDTVATPGADDNASGIAGLLELARLTSKEKTLHELRFVAFVNEEPPYSFSFLMGSRVYTRSLKENNERIKAAIVLEMIGFFSDELNSQTYPAPLGLFFPNRANFILIVGNKHSKKIAQQLMHWSNKASGITFRSFSLDYSGTDLSDHWSFWQEGYQAVMVTDTAFYRNDYYHTAEDTADTLNFEYMAETVLGLRQAIAKLANKQ